MALNPRAPSTPVERPVQSVGPPARRPRPTPRRARRRAAALDEPRAPPTRPRPRRAWTRSSGTSPRAGNAATARGPKGTSRWSLRPTRPS